MKIAFKLKIANQKSPMCWGDGLVRVRLARGFDKERVQTLDRLPDKPLNVTLMNVELSAAGKECAERRRQSTDSTARF